MIISSPPYVPKLEALHSLMLGIALAILTPIVAAMLIGLFDGEMWLSANRSIHTFGVIQTIQSVFFGLLATVFGLGFFYAFLLLLALPQYFLLLLPLLKFFSTGLQGDARRHWVFYVVSGILIGGLPWLGLTYFLFGNSTDFNDTLKLFVLPAFVIGAIAGAVLKYRLTKLAAAERIENDRI
jgi:hypothetical protein